MGDHITEFNSAATASAASIWGLIGAVNISARRHSFGRVTLIEVSGEETELQVDGLSEEDQCISFVFLRDGSISTFSNGQWSDLLSTLIVVPDGVRAWARLSGKWQVSLLRVPREVLEPFVNEIPTEITALARRSLLDRSVENFVGSLLEERGEPTPIEAYAVEQLLTEMAGAVLLDRMSGSWSQVDKPNTMLLNEAMAIIAQQCQDPEFGPGRVASEVNVSLRRVQAVFADAGTSAATEIRRRRSRVAHGILQNSRYDVLSIEQVAKQSGFGTAMSMRRALLDLYDLSPKEVRARRGQL